ncbi:MAG: 50S ribosomal protein L21 [Eubacteriales bacterium]|nr:50S ribosomal protein L21 [Eubacteriales bacterium]
MYAVIATGGKQYRVKEGEILHVEKLNVAEGDTYTFDNVLLVGGDDVKVGTPTVEGATVKAKVLANEKGKKVIVYKYKAKKGYHKKRGHRQQYTKVKIESIHA